MGCVTWLGAGKTTTFNMLTGDIRPSSGTALIAGYDIVSDIRKVHVSIPLHPTHCILLVLHRSSNTLDTVHRYWIVCMLCMCACICVLVCSVV